MNADYSDSYSYRAQCEWPFKVVRGLQMAGMPKSQAKALTNFCSISACATLGGSAVFFILSIELIDS